MAYLISALLWLSLFVGLQVYIGRVCRRTPALHSWSMMFRGIACLWCAFAVLKKWYIDEYMPPEDSLYHELIAREVADLVQRLRFGEAFTYFSIGNPAYRFILGLFYGLTNAPEILTYAINGALGFVGLIGVLEVLCLHTRCDRLPRLPVLVTMLCPSGLMWTTSNLKEGPVLWGIAMMLYWTCTAEVMRPQESSCARRRGCPLMGMLVVGLLRPHIAMLWLTAISLSMTQRSRGKSFMVVTAAGVLASVFLVKAMAPELYRSVMSDGVTSSLSDKHEQLTDNDDLVSHHFATSKPTPVLTGLFLIVSRPWPTEVASAGELLAGLEVWMLCALGGLYWYTCRQKLRLAKQAHFLTMLIALLMMSFVFSYMYNMGLVVRQRLMVFPAVLSIFFWPVFQPRVVRQSATRPVARRRRRVRGGILPVRSALETSHA